MLGTKRTHTMEMNVAEASKGSTVKIHYEGRLDDGTVFDSSEGRDPLSFTLGEGRVIPGFEDAVEGMSPGDAKTTTIPADQAYGERRDDLLLSVGRDQLPDDLEPEVGDPLQMRTQDGRVVQVMVARAEEEEVLLDANHPLAGKDLTFEIEVVEVA